MPNYRTYSERVPDFQYQQLLRKILTEGREVRVLQGEKALMICGYELRFKMENGFPLITERDLGGNFFKSALAEHLAFLHGIRTQKGLEKWGCKWWAKWVTKEKCQLFGLKKGDLGPGSYGPAWAKFPKPDGSYFNQIKSLIRMFKEAQRKSISIRTLEITPWIPFYLLTSKRKAVVAPCHGWIHVHIFPEEKEFKIEHRQRSADVPVGLVFNLVQYAAFGLMLEKISNFSFSELIYWITDAHIYESQIFYVQELLKREPRVFPQVKIITNKKNILGFKPEDFIIEEYFPYQKMIIPTPI